MVQDKEHRRAGDSALSHDTLFDGGLVCRQYREGYRFSLDPVLAAHFPTLKKNERILDLGCGCGIIGLILCYRHADKNISVTGLELQEDLARLARSNAESNGYQDRFLVIQGNVHDCREIFEAESFTQVIANPPFFGEGTGRLSSNHEAQLARHQQDGGIDLFVEAAAYSVKNRGRVTFIYPAELLAELLFCLYNRRITPKRMQAVYPYPGSKMASLVLIEGIKNGGTGMQILHPLNIHEYRNGPFSQAVSLMFKPGSAVS